MQKVSIVTAAFNSAEYIEIAYESILAQEIRDWEWIVVDDCSTDETLSILDRISGRDSRIRVFWNRQNMGAARSRNLAIKAATGEFVAFLDSDDRWLPEKLTTQIEFMEENNADASFSSYEIIRADGSSIGKTVDTHARGSITYAQALRKRATMGCSTIMLKRSSLGGSLMPDLRTGQDYAYWLLLMRKGLKFYHLNQVLTEYRITPGSISRNKFKKAKRQWEIYRRVEKLGFFSSALNFCFYAIRAVSR